MNERKFSWQPWIDPLGSNLSDFGPDDGIPEGTDIEFYNFAEASTSVNTASDLIPEFEEELRSKTHKIQPVKVVNTRLGLLTVVESTLANYHFDFWVMHSNKQFTEEDAKLIAEAEGVDCVMPLSRYRIKIGFPKSGLFNIGEVRKGVEEVLLTKESILNNRVEDLFTEDTQQNIDKKIDVLKKKGGKWLLYVLPNGSMEVFESENINNSYRTKLKMYEDTQNLVGGRVFKS